MVFTRVAMLILKVLSSAPFVGFSAATLPAGWPLTVVKSPAM